MFSTNWICPPACLPVCQLIAAVNDVNGGAGAPLVFAGGANGTAAAGVVSRLLGAARIVNIAGCRLPACRAEWPILAAMAGRGTLVGGPEHGGRWALTIVAAETEERSAAFSLFAPYGWNRQHFAYMLAQGVTRVWALGGEKADVELGVGGLWGIDAVDVASPALVAVEVRLRNFQVARDGHWCLFADTNLVSCFQQGSLTIDLNVTGAGERGLYAALKSNFYADVLRESPRIKLRVTSGTHTRVDETRGWTYHGGLVEKQLYMSVPFPVGDRH